MERVCVACQQAITDEEQWFRVREEYAHVACSDKYSKLLAARKRAEAEAPKKVPDAGG